MAYPVDVTIEYGEGERSRGLAVGHIFDHRGQHVASVAQEVLLRPERQER